MQQDNKSNPTLKDIFKTALDKPNPMSPRRPEEPSITIYGDRNVVMLRGTVTVSIREGSPSSRAFAARCHP